MTTTPSNIDPRAQRSGNVAKWLFLIFAFALLAPFIWLAVGGIIGFLFFVGIYIGAWMIRPWVFTKAANIRIKLLKGEALKNPIPTLQENYRKEMEALDIRKQKIIKLNAAIRDFRTQTEEIAERTSKNHPAYIKMSKDIVDLERIYADRSDKWNKAMEQLKRFGEEIEIAETVWEASLAAAGAREASGLTEEDWMTELKTKTALDSIQSNYNEALASLDTSMLEEAPTRSGHAVRTPVKDVES